ncbi:uncharacterized protein LOC123718743 [Pieris brassicae]|uniref:uncharacterized protein LOC123718743 n=1 Tax=Pieris brassicae TaxID=7116 RepID=UPI001E661449|nr:uncharacterized protein LOC123718743 [Pieris brassicae]
MEQNSLSTPTVFNGSASLPKLIKQNDIKSKDFGNDIDVMYLERLKAVHEKIKSCISCSQHECPFIKERINKHFTKHHTPANEGFQLQDGPAKVYRNPARNDIASKNEYRKLLRSTVIEWSKIIPVYPNQIFEFKKQNLLNLLVENINDLLKNINDEDYQFKLENIINSFLNSLPGFGKDKLLNDRLKENLLDRIYNLNNDHTNEKKDKAVETTDGLAENKNSEREHEDNSVKEIKIEKPEVKEVATCTLINDLLNKQNNATNTVIEYYNEVIGPEIFLNNKTKNVMNVQVSTSFNAHENMSYEKKTLFSQKVKEWMRFLMDNENYNFINNNVDKTFVVNILWDDLNEYLVGKTRKDKMVLKKKISMVLGQMPLSTAILEPRYKYEIENDLCNRLLCMDSDFTQTFSYVDKRKIQNIVDESLKALDLNVDNNTFNEIITIVLENLYEKTNNKLIKEELFSTINTLTKLTLGDCFDLVNTIVESVKSMQDNLDYNEHGTMTANSFGSTAFSGTLTIFASEQEMSNPTNHGKSIVNFNEVPKLSSYEITYVNKIVETINLWLDTLPKEFKSDEKREENIKYLAREIYDEIRLDDVGDESERDKFKAFIIRKWLNRFDFFERPHEAKSYIEDLVLDINDIPKVYLNEPKKGKIVVCCGSKIEPECAMKNLILKYIEYNDEEDSSDTRGIFATLLKSELPNLCIPSRKEVYDSLERNLQISTFKKLDKELFYIMLITDCMQDVPLSDSFTNKRRNELVTELAEHIYLVEESLLEDTIENLVNNFVSELPISILPDYKENFDVIVEDILYKIKNTTQARSCCNFAASDQVHTAINATNLGDYIESFIRDNYVTLTENETVLEVCSFRLLKEVNDLIVEDPAAFNTTEVYKRLGDDSLIPDQERRFSAELKYAREVSDWLHNLPLLPVINEEDSAIRNRKIIELIHKLQEYSNLMKQEPNDAMAKTNFSNYLERWLINFSLDSRKDIKMPLVIQQLLHRVERINKNEREMLKQANIVCKAPVPCCSHGKSKEKKPDPARVIVESIEKWCRDLPIDGETEDVNIIKDTVATKLYQKLGDINNSSMHNDESYRDALGHEIDSLIDTLPTNENLLNKKSFLKNKLLQIIMDNKKLLNQKLSGSQYKQRLENKIAMSLSNPVIRTQSEDPEFEIYKDLLATMFILDNFDYSNNNKLKYEKQIREQIDKYHQSALRRNPMSMAKEQMFVELYSALFQVPVPSDDSVSEEVEEIKTRCEIEIWFNKMPLTETKNASDALQRHKIISMLAKRLHQIENSEASPDEKIQKEILKWLRKLPLLPGKEAYIDQYASELRGKLKSTFAMRKCVSQVNITKLIEKVNSRTLIPHREGQTQTPLPNCCQVRPPDTKNATDKIIDFVEDWCRGLSIPARTQTEIDNVKAFKDNMVIKIIMKISQLNMNPELFNDDNNYKNALDEELDSLLATLPSCCDIVENKESKKKELIDAINEIKSLIVEENSRYKYKHDLKNVVNNVLETSNSPDSKSEIVNDIVDNFIFFHYCKDDIDGKQTYKIMITEDVKKCIAGTNESVFKSNKLVCELSKVPDPGDKIIADEVEEIRMKSEVKKFLNELPIREEKEPLRSQIKAPLARRLSDLEKSGHTNETEQKMKEEIKKCLKKIDESVDALQIDLFIEKLRNNEAERKSHSNVVFTTPPAYTHENKTNDNRSLIPISHADENRYKTIPQSSNTVDRHSGLDQDEETQSYLSEFEAGIRVESTPKENVNYEVFGRSTYSKQPKGTQNGNQVKKNNRNPKKEALKPIEKYNRYQISSDRIPDCNYERQMIEIKPCKRVQKSESCLKKLELICECNKQNFECGCQQRKI